MAIWEKTFFSADDILTIFSWSSSRQITRQLRLVETLLNLMVDEFNEGIVLLWQPLLKNLVVFLTNLVCPLLTHPFADDAHLFESENRLVFGSNQSFGADGLSRGGSSSCLGSRSFRWRRNCRLLLSRHRRRGSRLHGLRWAGRVWMCGALAGGLKVGHQLPALLHPLQLVPQVVSHLCGREGSLLEDRRRRRRSLSRGHLLLVALLVQGQSRGRQSWNLPRRRVAKWFPWFHLFDRSASSSLSMMGWSVGRVQGLQGIKVQRPLQCDTSHFFMSQFFDWSTK